MSTDRCRVRVEIGSLPRGKGGGGSPEFPIRLYFFIVGTVTQSRCSLLRYACGITLHALWRHRAILFVELFRVQTLKAIM